MAIKKITQEDLESAVKEFNRLKTRLRVSITSNCNLSCIFCHEEGLGDYSGSTRMKTKDFSEIIAAYVSVGGKEVNITGGEPLLHPNIKEMIGIVNQHKDIHTTLSTNGLLLDNINLDPRREPISETKISFHTQNPDLARTLLGKRYDINKVMSNVESHISKGYRTIVNLTLTKQNTSDLENIVDWVVGLGCNMKISDLGRTEKNAAFYDKNYENPDIANNIAKKYSLERKTIRSGAGNILIQYVLPRGNHIIIKDVHQGKHETQMCGECSSYDTCSEGVFALRVNPNGIYQPCILKKKYNLNPSDYGNANQKDLIQFAIYKMMRGGTGRLSGK